VDLGCGMMAVKTSMTAAQLPDDLKPIRDAIEKAVPVGRAGHGDLKGDHPARKPVENAWKKLSPGWYKILEKHPDVENGHVNHVTHIGSLGTGNHFIEVCLDESDQVWLMLHSGSRGVGNRIGTYFIELAQKDMKKHFINLPDEDLAYFNEGAEYFDDYLHAVEWAQQFAMINRVTMMDQVELALRKLGSLPGFELSQLVINCHHNYVAREEHFGQKLWLTRKGAVRAQAGDWGIIPGSMGVGSYIVRGKGNPESFNSCSHGAGRLMSRNQAKKQISLEQHLKDTAGVECRKDEGIIDESPSAYKPLDAVMAAQSDLVEIVHKLRPVVCVKG
jgi:tRNA-splicing ligase RtcB (3'-phosphate/5'-hydroxy nucleic acid ligase)